ncbi:hypothetical protein VP01_382g4 [Puccinia sorghi]|uniref:RRM domain-containing protein n=1 Tax=Puccinia sorghi TaxID=27349 RepID=A0A0L6UU16_9BASI|nr:hypothetical protein VP01_382g4 [Puccinia sorghi]
MQSIHYPQPYLVLPSQLHPSHPHPHLYPHPPPQDTRTQLFVNNLPFRVRWQDLKDLFRKAGTVLRADVSLTPDNRSKGFGTVLFANRNDAFKAVEIYNRFSWQTRILDTNKCIPPQPQNSILPSTGNPSSNAYQHNQIPLGGGTTTTTLTTDSQQTSSSATPNHTPSQASNVMPVTSSSSFPTVQPSTPESTINSSINIKPVHSYQKHQHSQSLIPLSDSPPNPSQSAVFNNPLLKTSNHRPSRSVQLFNPHNIPAAKSASSSTASRSQTPPSRSLDVHQPIFRPATTNSLNQPHAVHSQISAPQDASPATLPSVTISNTLPDPASSISSAPLDPSSTGSSPAGSIPNRHSSGTISNSSSLIGSTSSLNDGPVIHHPSLPSIHRYGPPHSYPPHHFSSASLSHASYLNPHGQNSASRLLFVGNLPFNLQWQDLKDLFRQAGNILRADVAMTGEGRSRGFGTVMFATAEDARKAQKMYDGYELKGRALKVRFDHPNHMPSSGTATTAQGTWPELPAIPPANFHPILHAQPQANRPPIQEPIPQVEKTAASAQDKVEDTRSDLWAPEPVRPTVRVSVPTIVPPALSPIASRRSSSFKPANGTTAEYAQPSSEGGVPPEPIGHPTSSQSRPQTIPMPPLYAPGLVSPALPKTIQMTPSMPAFSFQPFMPATPPLLPNFFSPGIAPPPTPPYGRDLNDPSQPAHSTLGFNPLFPDEEVPLGDGHEYDNIPSLGAPAAESDEEDEQVGTTMKRIDSNVDWGYQGITTAMRRTSLFVGRPGPSQGVSSVSARLASSRGGGGGFANRRLLRVGEELTGDEDGLAGADGGSSRRASFDVSSLFASSSSATPTPLKPLKPRPSNIFISSPSVSSSVPAAPVPAEKNITDPLPNVDSSELEPVDLVGLGFVDHIWTDR